MSVVAAVYVALMLAPPVVEPVKVVEQLAAFEDPETSTRPH